MNNRIAAPFGAALLAACAIMQSYSGTQPLERSPYYQTYAGYSVPPSTAVGHLAIKVDAGAVPDEHGREVLAPLADAMNAYLDSAGWSTRLAAAPPATGAPWAYVGSGSGLHARTNLPSDSTNRKAMVIQFLGPSRNWATRLREIADAQQVTLVLAVHVGPAEYFTLRRDGLEERPTERRERRERELDLGTDYRVRAEWLGDPDRPVQVLHLTGLLLTRDGKVLRAGAEGIVAKRPNFMGVGIGNENQLTDDEIASVLTSAHRDDIEGHPLAWQVALHNLVRQLLGTS